MESLPLNSAAPLGRLACRILLVEDDQDHRPLLSLMLRKAGAEVVVAENGKMAIEAACAARDAGKPLDLILMDVQMPVLDGCAAASQLRAAGFGNPIIALTARSDSAERDRCLAAGCDDFLTKPFSRADLIHRLAAHLAHFRARGEGSPG
jgi:CheY-like chemotaxis protein